MKREMHPMAAKKELARRIVTDFHSAEAAAKAGEDWARQFQKDEVPQEAEKVEIRIGLIAVSNPDDFKKPNWAAEEEPRKMICLPDEKTVVADTNFYVARVEKLLLGLGLVSSAAEGSRKLKEGAVTIRGEQMKGRYFAFVSVPTETVVRLGRRQKIASIVP
jgi:tyrosyl-tRNA synthetase